MRLLWKPWLEVPKAYRMFVAMPASPRTEICARENEPWGNKEPCAVFSSHSQLDRAAMQQEGNR